MNYFLDDYGFKIPEIPGVPASGPSFCAEYQAVYDAMTNKPSAADGTIQDTLMRVFVDSGVFAKAEFLDIFSVHTNAGGEAQINWHNPGTFDPVLVNNPGFVAYQGFTGNQAGGQYVRLNYDPSVDAIAASQDNACYIIGVATNLAEGRYDFGSTDGVRISRINSRNVAGNTVAALNSGGINSNAIASSVAHFAISRGVAANYDLYQNLALTNIVQASNGVPTEELYTCGYNNNGVAEANNRQIRYCLGFTYLTQPEIIIVINALEAYLDNYGTGLI